MTAARTRGCKRIRSNAERGKERLEGFTAVILKTGMQKLLYWG